MKIVLKLLLFILLLFTSAGVFAQARYNVSGVVTNEKGEPIKGATVFIGGSERVTPTDDNGRFTFAGMPQGSFQLSVQLLGYEAQTRNILVQSVPLNIELQLKSKYISLNEVNIGRKSDRDYNLYVFKENFLGTSANAKQSVILNPKVLNFSTKRGLLLADADEFLIIENKRLGYRIHYQLRDFGFSSKENTALYHGEYSFEELKGTEEQKKQWEKNRLETYNGSFMHFLRSVYNKNTVENGFITRPMYGMGTVRFDPDTPDPYKAIIKDRPVAFDSLVTAMGTSFMSFKFNQLYVIYDPEKAATYRYSRSNEKKNVVISRSASLLKLGTNEAVIDQKGSYTDYRDFYIQGVWAKARVGDQLPVEYQPPYTPPSRNDNATDKLVARLQTWTDSLPQEKMYLHLDKPYYAVYDTLWFKGYVTTGSRHQLSGISGSAYVDLIDDQDHPVKTLKLPVNSGTLVGNIILNDDIKRGSYRLRAYTQWMRNAGDSYFFDHSFTVGDPTDSKANTNPTAPLPQPDVQFFPESGNLVNNISSKVGFKAVGINGLGAAISGKITDNDNNAVADISTQHAGMGSFLLKPLPGKTYTANITFADGSTKSIALPKALDEGYVLSIYQPNKDSILVRVHASATLQQSTVNLIAHTSGETIFASPVKMTGALTSIWLNKQWFPSGIAQFTIFNTDNEPLNERIAFVKTDDNLKLTVNTAKPTYKSREHVQLDLTVIDDENSPTSANFSVAVTDADKVPVEEDAESTIFSNLLLTADLKGYIEKPNYYLTADTDEVNKALDNLMLTQGYRRFEWKQLDKIAAVKPAFGPEGLGIVISGQVNTLEHQPLPNARVKLVSVRAGFAADTVADANGRFRFKKVLINDSLKFAVQARDANNSDKVMITLDSIPQLGAPPHVNISNNKNAADLGIIATNLQKAIQEGKPVKLSGSTALRQVDIKALKKKVNTDNKFVPQGMFSITDASADKILTIPNPQDYTNLTMFMQTNLQGISVQNGPEGYKQLIDMRPSLDLLKTTDNTDKNAGRQIGLIVNGRKVFNDSEVDEILEGSIQPGDVAKIEVVRTNVAAVNFLRGLNDNYVGYVILVTKPPSARKQYNPSIANVMLKGFNKVRKFYSPRYDHSEDAKLPDQRSTIYWNPNLNVDATGKATFDLFNADGPATYRVVLEGINSAGELGRKVFTYKVE